MKHIVLGAALAGAMMATAASAAEPDGLVLPPGFHATVVAQGLGPLRHLAVRGNGDVYASIAGENTKALGVLVLRPGPDRSLRQVGSLKADSAGTGIRFHNGMLYVAGKDAVTRFRFRGNAPLPSGEPQAVVTGLAPGGNKPIAFDGGGNLYVGIDAETNACVASDAQKPVGHTPCAELKARGGIWKFAADKAGQKFSDGALFATGQRDITGMDWPAGGDALYAAMHGRDGSHRKWGSLISAADDDNIADEFDRLAQGADMGWPYTYYDGARRLRLMAPEYGGDGKKTAPAGRYVTPLASLFPMRAAPVDVLVYDGRQFPAEWRGAFLALHGTQGAPLPGGRNGYRVVFVPLDANGKAGAVKIFVDDFAGPSPASRNTGKAKYRPVGLAIAPDGALYMADSNVGRIWRISYGG